jgi:hypothetical protein
LKFLNVSGMGGIFVMKVFQDQRIRITVPFYLLQRILFIENSYAQFRNSQVKIYNEEKRRERDSNPRTRHRINGFQDRRYRPLSHLSKGATKVIEISDFGFLISDFLPLNPICPISTASS